MALSKNNKNMSIKPAKTENKSKNEKVKTPAQKEKSEKKAIYRVVYDKQDKRWLIKKDGAKRVIDSKCTKEEALARVQDLSESQDIKFVVHKKDGKFQKKQNLK